MRRLAETGPSGCCVAGRRGKRAIDQDGDVCVLVVEDVGQPRIASPNISGHDREVHVKVAGVFAGYQRKGVRLEFPILSLTPG